MDSADEFLLSSPLAPSVTVILSVLVITHLLSTYLFAYFGRFNPFKHSDPSTYCFKAILFYPGSDRWTPARGDTTGSLYFSIIFHSILIILFHLNCDNISHKFGYYLIKIRIILHPNMNSSCVGLLPRITSWELVKFPVRLSCRQVSDKFYQIFRRIQKLKQFCSIFIHIKSLNCLIKVLDIIKVKSHFHRN